MRVIRKVVEHLLSVGIAIALITAFVSTNAVNTANSRWQMPVTPSEAAFLEKLECVDNFINQIPPKSKVKVIAQIMEWNERIVEIGYPRITFTNSGEDLSLVLSSIRQDFAPVKCGDSLFVGINENLKCDANVYCILEG